MVLVKLKGGLGNQLFQYALARELSLRNNTDILLDFSSFRSDKLRNYSLDQFNIDAKIKTGLYSITTDSICLSFDPFFLKSNSNPLFTSLLIREKGFNFSPINCKQSKSIYLDGYWQSEKYFSSIRQDLLREFTLAPHLLMREKYINISNRIKNSNSVSVHIRRGDYISNPKTTQYHGICNKDWYLNAIQYLESQNSNLQYFIFSDDPAWAKENITPNASAQYIHPGDAGEEAIDIILMSLCSHNIIANSSFSWWGAWLNQNPAKQVIAPKNWFLHAKNDTSDLLPETWTKT